MAAGHRSLLLLAAAFLAVVVVALADDAKPTILTPVAKTPVGSFEGDTPASDSVEDDDDAAPIGAPIGTTMTEPKPELTTTPGAAGDAAAASAAAASLPLGLVAHVGALAAAAAGAFAF